METARAAKGGRRHNLSLRQLSPRRRREANATDRAFEAFYRKHVAEVYQYALAVLTNPTDAEDVTQQTFLNAYKAFQKGERPHTPHNWLIKIAHNVCRMRWRQASRRPQEVALDNAPEPASYDEEKPSLDEVLGALARLPFNQRAAIVMREVEGRTYAEIADVLSTSVPAVEALLFRARTNLRSRRKALGVLSIAPVPGSLSTFFGGGSGGLLAAGGAAVGTEAVLKVAAVVISGVVAGGLGFKTVKAIAKPESHQLPKQVFRHHRDPVWANPAQRIERVAHTAAVKERTFEHPGRSARTHGGKLRQAPTGDHASQTDVAAGSSGSAQSGSEAATSGPGAQEPASTVKKVVASVPTPPLPPPPATVPLPVPPPPTTLPSVTVTVPTLPLPPPPLK
jgi:RNA polymerase sigma-70 factor (ECF subfamily)